MKQYKTTDNIKMVTDMLAAQEKSRALYKASPKTYLNQIPWYALFCDPTTMSEIRHFGSMDEEYSKLHGLKKWKVFQDILLWDYAYGYSPEDYFTYGFAHKTPKERLAYISELEAGSQVLFATKAPALTQFVGLDKYSFYELFRPLFCRDIVLVTPEGLTDDECLSFLRKHDAFITKPYNDYGGHGVRKIAVEHGKEETILAEMRKEAPILLEEFLVQSAEMNYLNPSSVNTVRVTTFLGGNQFEIAFIALRIGRARSVVDNISSGGMSMLVDPKTHKTGHVVYRSPQLFTDTHHPDSGHELADFELPDWDGLMAVLARGIAMVPKGACYCGWDFAHTDKGWALVECNDCASYAISQSITLAPERDHFYALLNKYLKLEEKQHV